MSAPRITVTTAARPSVTVTSPGPQGPAGQTGNIPTTVVFVDAPADLPAPVANVHTLAANTTYIICGTVDLLGNRIICGANTTIRGAGSAENCRLKSTGLTGTALITSTHSLPLLNLTIEADIALALNGPNESLNWLGVHFADCGTVGTIANHASFLAVDCTWLNSGAMTFDGTLGTIGFTQCDFSPKAGGTSLVVAATATITNLFRLVHSSFTVASGRTGIDFNSSAAVPDEGYVLDTVSFSGAGTYAIGVSHASDKARWFACTGVSNSAVIAQMYMTNNAVATTVTVQNDSYAMAGVTSFSSALSQRFAHVLADNALRYTSAVPRRVKVQCSFSCEASNNNVIGVFIGKCTSGNGLDPANDRVLESEVAVTTNGLGSRPDSGFAQALVDINEDDKLYLIVQNTSGAGNVIVRFMNMLVEQIAT